MDKYSMPSMETLFSDRAEKDFEFEEALPEYCPNLMRVVRADAYPSVAEKSFDGTNIALSGKLNVRVIYASDYHDKLKGVFFSEDFSHSFPVRDFDGDEETLLDADAVTVSVSAKVSSARAVSVRCRVGLSAGLYAVRENRMFAPDENGDMCTLEQTQPVCIRKKLPAFRNVCEKDVQLEATEPCVSEIIYANAVFCCDKTQCFDGKFDYRGHIDLHLMYEAENTSNDDGTASYVTVEREIPVEGSFEDPSFGQGQSCVAKFVAGNVETGVSYDPYGENRIISVTVPYILHCEVYECTEVSVCTDAFSTKYKSSVRMGTYNCEVVGDAVNENAHVSEKLHTDLKNFVDITDSHAELRVTGVENADGRMFVNARGTLFLFGKGDNGAFNSADVPLNVHIPLQLVPDSGKADSHFDASVQVKRVDVSASGGELVCDMEVGVDGMGLDRKRVDGVSEVAVDIDHKLREDNEGLVICYPSADDTVWSIAKSYGVPPDIIRDVNSVKELDGKQKMLIIP